MSDTKTWQSMHTTEAEACTVADGLSSMVCGLEREICRRIAERPLRWVAVAASIGFAAGVLVCRR